MTAICLGFAYLLAHLLLYAVHLRNVPLLQTEKGIFLYHFVSVCLAVAATLALTLPHGIGESLTVTAAVAAAHGIYSLSFLELWSLAEGSYSFKVLASIESRGSAAPATIVSALAEVGDRKKGQRLDSLRRLKLIEQTGDSLRLTRRGRRAAMVFRLLRWLANLRDTG